MYMSFVTEWPKGKIIRFLKIALFDMQNFVCNLFHLLIALRKALYVFMEMFYNIPAPGHLLGITWVTWK
jgi:hypothetical protein